MFLEDTFFLIKKLIIPKILYVINNSIQLPILNHKFIGIINAIEDKRNPISNSFLRLEYIIPCMINIIGNSKNNPTNIFLSALPHKVIASIKIHGNIIDNIFFMISPFQI